MISAKGIFMEKTIRLFDISSKAAFDAAVIFCGELDGGNFEVVLDRTAFFLEEGGQSCDGGTLGGAVVLSVDEREGVIYHVTDKPLAIGGSDVSEADTVFRIERRMRAGRIGVAVKLGTDPEGMKLYAQANDLVGAVAEMKVK